MCEELVKRFAGKVTILSTTWHAGYHATKDLTEWYRRTRPPPDVLICLYLMLQCFPRDYPVSGPLYWATEAIADAIPPCAVKNFLLSPRLGLRIVDALPTSGTVVDFAAGIGGWALGLYYALEAVGKRADYVVYAYDIDGRRLEVYRRGVEKETGWKVVTRKVDLTRKLPEESADVATGSPPCEKLSVANHGYDLEKGLVLVRRYLEYVDYVRPKVALFEEVAFMHSVRDAITKLLRQHGWHYEIRCLSEYGVPQSCRRRVLGWKIL